MKIEQFVMAYGAEQDRLRALLPDGFESLRPVLRINAEIRDGASGYLERNMPVRRGENRGWLNIAFWDGVRFLRQGNTVTFQTGFLDISFTGTGALGGCPAEKDNCGCYFPGKTPMLRPPEVIESRKEFCDCTFRWKFSNGDACGVSTGKTLPAYSSEVRTVYAKVNCTAENAARIPCEQVLGAYTVMFER